MKPVTRSVSMSTERPRRMISSPSQQVSAVVATRDFLLRLINTKETPRIPREVRREARALLRHYPIAEHLRPVLEQGLNSENSRIDCIKGSIAMSLVDPYHDRVFRNGRLYGVNYNEMIKQYRYLTLWQLVVQGRYGPGS